MTSKTILGDLDVHPVKSWWHKVGMYQHLKHSSDFEFIDSFEPLTHNMDLSNSLYVDGAKTFWDVACRPVLERGKRVTRRGGGEGYGEEEEK